MAERRILPKSVPNSNLKQMEHRGAGRPGGTIIRVAATTLGNVISTFHSDIEGDGIL